MINGMPRIYSNKWYHELGCQEVAGLLISMRKGAREFVESVELVACGGRKVLLAAKILCSVGIGRGGGATRGRGTYPSDRERSRRVRG